MSISQEEKGVDSSGAFVDADLKASRSQQRVTNDLLSLRERSATLVSKPRIAFGAHEGMHFQTERSSTSGRNPTPPSVLRSCPQDPFSMARESSTLDDMRIRTPNELRSLACARHKCTSWQVV